MLHARSAIHGHCGLMECFTPAVPSMATAGGCSPSGRAVLESLVKQDCYSKIISLMHIPADAVIATDKLTGYLLVAKPLDDKSKFWRVRALPIRTSTSWRRPYGNLPRSLRLGKMAGTNTASSGGLQAGCRGLPANCRS